MKYYVIYLSKMLCDIEECDVIKETDKTFVIKIKDYSSEYRVKKSEMKFGDLFPKLLVPTLEEAEKKQKELLQSKIKQKKEKIKEIELDIKEIKEFLGEK